MATFLGKFERYVFQMIRYDRMMIDIHKDLIPASAIGNNASIITAVRCLVKRVPSTEKVF